MNLTSAFAPLKGQEEYRLEGQSFKEASLIGPNGALFSWCKTSERFLEGMTLLPLGLSLWNYPGDERDFCPCWCWRGNFPVYQQWLNCNHQWCWAVSSCPYKVHKEVSNWLYRGTLRSTWLVTHHLQWSTCLIDGSGWSLLRSLNSCCHRLSEAVLLECWGSRFVRFLWGIWLNGCVNRLGRLGRLSGIWLDMATGSQNQGMMGHPGAIRMIILYGESCNMTALPNMADNEKVYASWSYHGKLSAFTAVTRGSGTGDTNKGNLLLNLMANRSSWGRCHLLHIAWKTSWRRDHSDWVVWSSLDSLSATILSQPVSGF